MYDTITKYNGQHHTPLPNVDIREVINQVTRKEEAESNNTTVDTFITQRNESDNIINKPENLKNKRRQKQHNQRSRKFDN